MHLDDTNVCRSMHLRDEINSAVSLSDEFDRSSSVAGRYPSFLPLRIYAKGDTLCERGHAYARDAA